MSSTSCGFIIIINRPAASATQSNSLMHLRLWLCTLPARDTCRTGCKASNAEQCWYHQLVFE
jgi:hypothetical protein